MSDQEEQDPNEAMADEWAAALEEQASEEGAESGDDTAATEDGGGEAASFDELSETEHGCPDSDVNLQAILDVPVTLSMEIGRTRIKIRNLLQLNQGSVVELDRLAGEPLDVLVNGTLVAQGEVVVVNEKFGIRLTDIISPADRVTKLK